MWRNIEDEITGDVVRMKTAAAKFRNRPSGGTLSLDRTFEAPAYARHTDIHGQPGGYLREDGDDDLVAGALYESGGNAYTFGMGASTRDSKALAIIRFLERRYPRFHPLRILDLGCSAGSASCAYAACFPDAEVHAVDIGPALLRYAHVRAEALQVRVHFHQMDAAHLAFPADHFDFVVSHNLMHEVAKDALPQIFREAHRVVRPGGLVLHQDVYVRSADATPFERFMFKWQTDNNNEPFLGGFCRRRYRRAYARGGLFGRCDCGNSRSRDRCQSQTLVLRAGRKTRYRRCACRTLRRSNRMTKKAPFRSALYVKKGLP